MAVSLTPSESVFRGESIVRDAEGDGTRGVVEDSLDEMKDVC